MLHKQMFMRDQMNNCISIIMGEDKPSYLERVEEILVALLFVTLFIVGARL
ncbi:MAG: hypothetical protein ABL925_15455 [Methylococcales bacterium]